MTPQENGQKNTECGFYKANDLVFSKISANVALDYTLIWGQISNPVICRNMAGP